MEEINKKINENTDICFLLDFYGQLLTDKTREILELHFAEDMSLAEISDQYRISRQAVHDTIKRGVATLTGYEEKLNLANKFKMQQEFILEAISDMDIGEIPTAKEKLLKLTQII
ncbi:MAG: YlxM family DNA-binding protein [Saccharofermentanales bacterium]